MISHKLHVADQQMMCYRTSQVHMMIILKKGTNTKNER